MHALRTSSPKPWRIDAARQPAMLQQQQRITHLPRAGHARRAVTLCKPAHAAIAGYPLPLHCLALAARARALTRQRHPRQPGRVNENDSDNDNDNCSHLRLWRCPPGRDQRRGRGGVVRVLCCTGCPHQPFQKSPKTIISNSPHLSTNSTKTLHLPCWAKIFPPNPPKKNSLKTLAL